MKKILLLTVVILGVALAACGGSGETEITATIAEHAGIAGGPQPGDPLADAAVRLYDGDDIVAEATLDDAGTVTVDWPEGAFTVQVELPTGEPGCWWSATVFDVSLPDHLEIAADHICTGDPSDE